MSEAGGSPSGAASARADQTADNFRSLIALILSAALGADLLQGDSLSSQPGVVQAASEPCVELLAVVALFCLGQSWLLQKRKAQARKDYPSLKDETLGLFLRNWIYDAAAFSLLLASGILIGWGQNMWGFVFATCAAVLFFGMTVFLRCGVKRWEREKSLCLVVKKPEKK